MRETVCESLFPIEVFRNLLGGSAEKLSAQKITASHKLHPLSANASLCFEPVMHIVGACSSAAYAHPHI